MGILGIFHTNTMTLTHANGTVVATGLKCQLDTVNVPLNMEVQGTIPTDWYDLYSVNWTSPLPLRSDYFVDEKTGVKYSVFGNVAPYSDHIEVRISRYAGSTP